MTEHDEIEDFIRESFERNYESLRVEAWHAMPPDRRQMALDQVLMYWRKLKHVAGNVSDTEVRLSLPNLRTKKGRPFTVEGVVDIVREGDRTVMYDFKTGSLDDIRAQLEKFESQLNVYAHIWQNLRQQELDGMAVIATDIPDPVLACLDPSVEEAERERVMAGWDPVIEIAPSPDRVEKTISDFGRVVDLIESGEFAAPSLQVLKGNIGGRQRGERFATRVCSNCDARFSCNSYRAYAGGSGQTERKFPKFYLELPAEAEQDMWRDASLTAPEDNDEYF